MRQRHQSSLQGAPRELGAGPTKQETESWVESWADESERQVSPQTRRCQVEKRAVFLRVDFCLEVCREGVQIAVQPQEGRCQFLCGALNSLQPPASSLAKTGKQEVPQ